MEYKRQYSNLNFDDISDVWSGCGQVDGQCQEAWGLSTYLAQIGLSHQRLDLCSKHTINYSYLLAMGEIAPIPASLASQGVLC